MKKMQPPSSPQSSNGEKTRPFRLVKYFTVTSLALIFIGTIILSILTTHWARAMQRKKSEEFAILILENLNHQIFLQFVLPVAIRFGKIQLREKEQFERLDNVVRNTIHSFNVNMVNIYNMENVLAYSLNPDIVGHKNLGGTGYQRALTGKTVFKQLQRGSFWQIALGIPKESQLVTFAPLRAEKSMARISGPILGVIEIIQDLSQEYKTIFRFQVFIVFTSAAVMLILLLMLILVVKRGENIIEKRARERLRLKEQLNRAERLSSIGEMAAVISHEIRNPLGIIRSSAEHLKKKLIEIDASSVFPNIIIEESSRLNNIITDFLDFARPRNPQFAPCRVDEIIEKNLVHITSLFAEKGCGITTTVEEHLPEVNADADMLYQVFLNILNNAAQSMENGGQIFIDIKRNQETVDIRFDDEGPGVAEKVLEKIWDPFFTTKEKGTGLGLGIIKNIIDLHGGNIGISNRPEGGASVLIQLPLPPGE